MPTEASDAETGGAVVVQCSVCHKEVPRAQARNREAADLVMYFCSAECFEKWRQTQEPEAVNV